MSTSCKNCKMYSDIFNERRYCHMHGPTTDHHKDHTSFKLYREAKKRAEMRAEPFVNLLKRQESNIRFKLISVAEELIKFGGISSR